MRALALLGFVALSACGGGGGGGGSGGTDDTFFGGGGHILPEPVMVVADAWPFGSVTLFNDGEMRLVP